MKIQVESISREIIKPSSPTPSHLRHYQLSFLDQVSPPVFMPFLFFYSEEKHDKLNHRDKSNHLKKHLSDILTQFYPLAGRVIENLYVDCNDQGIPYAEARIDCRLSEVIGDPIPGELNKFLPCQLDDVGDLPLAIQVNFFNCGGIAVCVAISHKVADALSSIAFVNSWAAAARGGDVPSPQLTAASLFPPKDIAGFLPSTGVIKDRIVTKRFLITSSKIASLRERCTDKLKHNTNEDEGRPRPPTRVEALSAFLWSRFMASTVEKKDPNKMYTVLHAVNLRTRTDPPLSEHYFGNITRVAITQPVIDGDGDWCGIVNQVREEIKRVDRNFVRVLREDDNHVNFMKKRAEEFIKGEVVSFSFTSLCRFPLYEADFGWGKPAWVGSASMPFKNLVVFMDAQSGDGIEAWVNLKEEDMAKFEVDEEFLAFASPTKGSKTLGF
ncbi:shikimate O-hydroxycinnamoyltransferase [Sarracenia purpurea var. burkii]